MTDWKDYYEAGGLMLLDRYTTSNAVHQGAKLGEGEQPAFFDWLYDLEYVKLGLPRPDLVIYLDVDLETSLARVRHRQEKTGQGRRHPREGRRLPRQMHRHRKPRRRPLRLEARGLQEKRPDPRA